MNNQHTEKSYSLRQRLIATALPFLCVFLLLLGYVLEQSVKQSLQVSVREQTTLQIRLLLADTDVVANDVQFPDMPQEPRLKQPDSDLFSFVINESGEVVWRSPSMLSSAYLEEGRVNELVTKISTTKQGESQFFVSNKGEFISALTVAFAYEESVEKPLTEELSPEPENNVMVSSQYIFVVVDKGESYALQQKAFRETLWFWLTAALLLLLAVQTMLFSWAFKPLVKVVDELNRVKQGKQEFFEELYPDEIKPLTDNLNRFIVEERQQRERYKNTLSDLAHSLKTPLAALRSMLESQEHDKPLLSQLDRMSQIVAHQLKRSRVSTANKMQVLRIDICPVINKLLQALQKIYADKAVLVDNAVTSQLFLAIEEDDGMELLGNILDNAFKYCQTQVAINTELQGKDGKQFCRVHIEDDGLGVESVLAKTVLQRGTRLDEKHEGQGIGLAVALDIVDSYGGSLDISVSGLGGAKVSVLLPLY